MILYKVNKKLSTFISDQRENQLNLNNECRLLELGLYVGRFLENSKMVFQVSFFG
jgi:hypothetical protein